MTKHILDRPRSAAQARLARFLELARAQGPHNASRSLHQRKRSQKQAKLAIYTAIQRRGEA
ncbi:MAG: hypothetical protein ACK4LQ_05140 [Pararhodobacter sp.]